MTDFVIGLSWPVSVYGFRPDQLRVLSIFDTDMVVDPRTPHCAEIYVCLCACVITSNSNIRCYVIILEL
jgi:hypothetical protein